MPIEWPTEVASRSDVSCTNTIHCYWSTGHPKKKVTKVSFGNVLKVLFSPVSKIAFSSLLCAWLSILNTQSCGYLCLHSKSTKFPMAPFTQMNFQHVPTRMERRILNESSQAALVPLFELDSVSCLGWSPDYVRRLKGNTSASSTLASKSLASPAGSWDYLGALVDTLQPLNMITQ